ncbi:hypothetical protein B9Z19DRAFT_1191698 [Tuber borchii]|uniref:Secreted protein n=1 Tax=Tuber borchii TaxID=42251 RepID=A0A2T6ZYU8_TUBBO|nr:hypothetical protein B9Z19DRAFT_1191698 [Tuber borchii]
MAQPKIRTLLVYSQIVLATIGFAVAAPNARSEIRRPPGFLDGNSSTTSNNHHKKNPNSNPNQQRGENAQTERKNFQRTGIICNLWAFSLSLSPSLRPRNRR